MQDGTILFNPDEHKQRRELTNTQNEYINNIQQYFEKIPPLIKEFTEETIFLNPGRQQQFQANLSESASFVSESYLNSSLTSDSIIPPEDLKELVLNKDYVLLVHYANKGYGKAKEFLKKDGLRSLEDIYLQGKASPEEVERYTIRKSISGIKNDPGLIYFRLVGNNSISNDGILIAVKIENVFVYDQEHRSHGNYDSYVNSEIPIIDFIKNYSRFKSIYYDKAANKEYGYMPEVTVRTKHIDPRLFIEPEKIGINSLN
ncbi:hypothetical protein [Candidatus Regiella endosymbiont of Tuberolachnus salignus]|uniref:hypothetical protein n=1 Tax=Candidatus Regiella endosymbiont of Tuberolachnus salignus TaxID=3077956 RepID=UPI0030D01B3F